MGAVTMRLNRTERSVDTTPGTWALTPPPTTHKGGTHPPLLKVEYMESALPQSNSNSFEEGEISNPLISIAIHCRLGQKMCIK